MAQTAMFTLARAPGLEPGTLGFGDCCFVNENSENACKLPENVQRTRAQSANRIQFNNAAKRGTNHDYTAMRRNWKMIELFVEFFIDDQTHQDRVMFCTWGDQLESVVPQNDKDCEPFTFETMEECEESALWYGVIATANSLKNNPFHYLGPAENRKTLTGPVVPYCVSLAVA